MSIVTQRLDAPCSGWDDFVAAHPLGTFFHTSGWLRVLRDYFGYDCHYLYLRDGDRIRGVLPLTHFRNPLAGNTLSSSPFLVYGGPLADDDETLRLLLDAAVELGRELGVAHIEIRDRSQSFDGWSPKSLYVWFRKALEADDEANLLAIPRKQRAVIRKAEKQGLEVSSDLDLDVFYDIFVQSYRNLGTPVFAKSLFEFLLDVFGDQVWMTTIHNDVGPLASVMSFVYRDEVLPYYGGGTFAARNHGANDFMYWAVMRRAVAAGLKQYDFGRSKTGTGSYRFKKHWGFPELPLHYQYRLLHASEIPDLSPNNPKYRLAIAAWQRMPLALTKLIGPPIAKRVG